jgi:hypothetical protein
VIEVAVSGVDRWLRTQRGPARQGPCRAYAYVADSSRRGDGDAVADTVEIRPLWEDGVAVAGAPAVAGRAVLGLPRLVRLEPLRESGPMVSPGVSWGQTLAGGSTVLIAPAVAPGRVISVAVSGSNKGSGRTAARRGRGLAGRSRMSAIQVGGSATRTLWRTR